MIGNKIHALAQKLWKINRSITGEGVRHTLAELKQLYKLLYRSNLNTKQALAEFDASSAVEDVKYLLDFIQHDTSRGISKKVAVEATSE